MYFPKSQIEPNLYTNGNELVYESNLTDYVGFYFRTSTGKLYTGAYPSNSSQELVLPPVDKVEEKIVTPTYEYDFTPASMLEEGEEPENVPNIKPITIEGNIAGPNNQTYLSLNPLPKKRLIPYFSPSRPTDEQIDQGEYTRYFAKSNKQNLYIEIDKLQYDQFLNLDPNVAFDLYAVTFLPWSLEGASGVNKNIVLLREKQLGWSMFHHYFGNNFGGTSIQKTDNLYTKGGEFLLPNRTNYIGYYHIMPNGGFMTGRFHGDGVEIILISLKSSTTSLSNTSTSIPSSGGGSMGGGGGGY